ncbi:protein NRT1/ PTR FAMILY 4.5-like [Melia azedarach]|uniref:Protein NRT1/ PTR FAMILY 4.5-like n=1 Tax=Melia azedarach TaxID=155640 RepID=A0ACC1WXB7_MELAZ|nr:protein NRT1/ PTR FAMILY 4.5-like [Melia azedarach]
MEKPELVEGKVDWKGRSALKYKHGGIKTSLLILAAFGFENLGTFSLAVNLVTYFNGVMHLELAEAANQVTNYMGTSYILCILVALLADTCTGRFKAVLISGTFEFLGLALITIQAHYPQLKPPVCNVFDPNAHCKKIRGGDAALLFVGLYLVAIGTAGIKAALPSHGADQFDEKDPREARHMSSFFNCLLLAVCVGGAVSLTLVVWIQDNRGWDWGFGVSTVAIFLAMVIFAAGLPQYRLQVVQGTSAIIEIIQVYVAALRNRKLQLPEDPRDLYENNKDKEAAIETEFLPHRDIYRYLDKAAIQTTATRNFDKPEALNPWKLCRVTQVENAKIILGMIPIFCCTIVMTLCLAQLQTFSIQQGLTMDTSVTKSFNIPPASLPIIPIIFMIIVVPVYDRIFVPFARRITGHPTGITHLQRVGVGLVLSSISMATAALLEVKRKGVARDHNMLDAIPVVQPLPISTFWLSIQFFIFGIADMFTYVGLLEFFYSEAPQGLKSISTCFLWSSMALGYFCSTILVKIVNSATKGITKSGGWLAGNNINRNHLNLFFWLLSALSMVNFFVYLFVSRRYNYRPQNPVVTDGKNESCSQDMVINGDNKSVSLEISK